MSSETPNIIPVAASPEEFALWPFLETLYGWSEAQGWYEAEREAAWTAFSRPASPLKAVPFPVETDPDGLDRLNRFRAYFAFDRPLATGLRPIEAFVAACRADLTPEGLATYEGLQGTVFGAFRVGRTVPGRLAVLEATGSLERYTLNEPLITAELQRGDLVVGRLYPYEGAYVADPDVHIGPFSEAPQGPNFGAPEAESRYYEAMVPAKGHVLDVIDALLMQVDSPLTGDDLLEMLGEAESLEALVTDLYQAPSYRLRYLHMRDRALLDELFQELWDTSGPLADAELATADAAALARAVRAGLRAIAEGDEAALRALWDPEGFLPIYLDLFGLKGLQRLAGVDNGAPGAAIRTKHQLLPKDGGIFTTLAWGKDANRQVAGMVSHGTPTGGWQLSDLSPPEEASTRLAMAYDTAKSLGWATPEAADGVEALLRSAVAEVGYSVHDTIDLFRLWRDFKRAESPDLAQPAIWAAGVELLDSRYRNENLDIKVLSRTYGVMPRAIEGAADEIDRALQALYPKEPVT